MDLKSEINVDYVREKLTQVEGKVGFYYKNLVTGEERGINEDKGFMAASVIKIPVIIETFKQMKENKFSKLDTVVIQAQDKLPSCGALNYMHDGLEVTIEDLYVLMIIHSDNTATNLLIKKVGMENINTTMQNFGLTETKINRLLFDSKASKEGKENYISPKDMGILLERLYQNTLLDRESDNEIIRILKLQRLNHKIPYLITDKVEIAHKTGEDSGITNDVGIIFSKTPFIVCFTSNDVNVKKFERVIQKSSLKLYEQHK